MTCIIQCSTSWVASSPMLLYFALYSHRGNWKSKVGIVIRLWAGRSGIRIMDRTRDFSVFHNVQTGSGAPHTASSSMSIVILPWGYRAWDTPLHPGLRLRMSGVTSIPLPPYAFMVMTGSTYPLSSHKQPFMFPSFPTPFCVPYFISIYSTYFMSPTC